MGLQLARLYQQLAIEPGAAQSQWQLKDKSSRVKILERV
jgi:hypothetical protein